MKGTVIVPVFVPHAGCPNDCSFCNQRTISGTARPPAPAEAAAIFAAAAESLGERMRTAQLAFFGGSFTAIEESYRIAILEAAQPFLGPDGFSGIRISTRPDCITTPILDQMERYGVTAIELGVQSMRDSVLEANRRGHTARDVERAVALIRERKLSLGLQMMTGLYGDDDAGAVETAQRLISLAPDMVRVYPTLVLRGTRLETLYREGRYTPCTLEDAVSLGARLLELFARRGIPVIRLGLHDEADMDIVAGPHHPALRELCESRLLLNQVWRLIEGNRLSAGRLDIQVHPRCISKMTGQHRGNIRALEARGYLARVTANDQVHPMEVILICN